MRTACGLPIGGAGVDVGPFFEAVSVHRTTLLTLQGAPVPTCSVSGPKNSCALQVENGDR